MKTTTYKNHAGNKERYEHMKTAQRKEYRRKKRARMCAATGCTQKAERRGRKVLSRCADHLKSINECVRKHFANKGQPRRTRDEWRNDLRNASLNREIRALAEERARKAAAVKETFCSCGLRAHGECDMPARRIAIRTAGLGAWA